MPSIFDDVKPLSAADQRLVDGYVASGRTTDDLPYSPEFDDFLRTLRDSGDERTEQEIVNRLFRLRKSARLPVLGLRSAPIGSVSPQDVELANFLLNKTVGSVGSRDQLPYTPRFETMFEAYNRDATRPLDKHQFWRLLARIAK